MRVLAIFLAILLPAFASDTNQPPKIIFWNMQRRSVDMLIHNVPQRDSDRLAQLKQTFHDLECKGDNLRERPAGEGTNLICTLPGTAISFPQRNSRLISAPEAEDAGKPARAARKDRKWHRRV